MNYLIILFMLISVENYAQTYTSNSVVECGGVRITAQEIIEQRIPLASLNSSMPGECRTVSQNVKSKWREDDKTNIDRIINEYCSHKTGWTEFVSGTCQAGGPPPICTANHWYKDINRAREQWDEKLNKVLKERAEVARSVACDCWGGSLQNAFFAQNNDLMKAIVTESDPGNNPSRDIITPCLQIAGSNPCPPGYKCVNGYCLPENEVQKSASTLNGLGAGKGIEKLSKAALTNVLSRFSSTLSSAFKVFNSPWVQAGMKAFTPSSIATNLDGYENSSNRLKEDLNSYYSLLSELNRNAHNVAPARNKGDIITDLNKTKSSMNEDFLLMDQFYRGMKIEKELFKCKDCCESAFDIYNKQLGTYYLIFNSIKY